MHSHDHSHAVPAADPTLRFYLGIALNLIFTGIEAVYGVLTGSMALVADAGHNLTDVLGLVLGLLAVYLGRRKPSPRFTYGLGRSSILIALVNGVLLLVAAGGLAWETIERMAHPHEIPAWPVIIVAAIGVLINTVSTLLFLKGSKEDLNLRGAFLHLAADALVSLGVVLGGLIMLYTGWMIVDSILGIIIIIVIVISTLGLLKNALGLSLDAVPEGIDMDELQGYFSGVEPIESFHDLHVWAMSTTRNALTVHLVLPKEKDEGPLDLDALLQRIQHDLEHRFGIAHSTLQFEGTNLHCGCR